MTSAQKPTAGPWEISQYGEIMQVGDVWKRGILVNGVSLPCGNNSSVHEAKANARLLFEAGNVHHETGLTPRQLQLERINLIVALHNIADIEDELDGSDWSEISHARDIARAAIAKCEAKP